MKRSKWDPKTKAMIVLQGLKGKPVVELCTEHQISQARIALAVNSGPLSERMCSGTPLKTKS